MGRVGMEMGRGSDGEMVVRVVRVVVDGDSKGYD
jgi:hypothetical protein